VWISEQDRQCTYDVTLRRVRVTTVTVEQYYLFHGASACVGMPGRVDVCMSMRARVALYIQHVTRVRHTVLSFVAPVAPPYILIYLVNNTIFEKKLLNIKCVFSFSLQLLFETFLILRRIQRDIVINVKTSSCKVPDILVGF
jgi:hypothetical protein